MKQLIQNLKSGETIIEEVPSPALLPGQVLIKTTNSLISTGTEKMLVEFSKANLLSKARQNPDRVAQVFEKIKTDGFLPTLEAVFRRLDEPLPLGYCNVGIIQAIGEGVSEFKIGDRVVSNGMHAEYVAAPKNMVALIPNKVSNEAATFTVVGAIGLQAIRLAQPELGDTVVIIGLGLIGLLTCQIATANGCRVIAFDIDENKIEIARQLNINAYHSVNDDITATIENLTKGIGADLVIIAASAKNDNLINTAATITRKLGKIILIGVINLNIDRSAFYKKEIQFQVSCSYGPGRYDDNYEQKGIDYPTDYVKWTMKRNFMAVLECLNSNKIITAPLITSRVEFHEAVNIYNNISTSNTIATVINYNAAVEPLQKLTVNQTSASIGTKTIGIIGAGNFSKLTLLPTLKQSGFSIKYISANDGLDAKLLAKKYNIANAVTNNDIIFNDPEVALIIIATRHDSHAALIVSALNANKHVFVEKPLALNNEELQTIEFCYQNKSNLLLFTGFNRRHAQLAQKAKSLLPSNALMNINITVNAGKLPAEHWLLNDAIGGGRIIGEACHFFDLMSFFTGGKIVTVYATSAPITNFIENTIIHLTYDNGSHGTITYVSNGSNAFPKETISIYCNNKVLVLDNFKKLTGYGFADFKSKKCTQDKGHKQQFEKIQQIIINGGEAYTSFESLKNTTLATFASLQSIKLNKAITI